MGQRRNRFGFVPLRAPEPKFKRPLPVPSHLRTNDIPDEERELLQWESEAQRENLARRERMSPLSRMVEDSISGLMDFGKGFLVGGSDERPGMTAENAGELVQAGLPFAAYKNLGKLPFGHTFHGTQKWKPGEKIDFDRFDTSDVLGWMFHSAEDPEYAGRYAMGQAKGQNIGGYGSKAPITQSDLQSYDPNIGRYIKLQPHIIPLEIEAKNVLDLVDPNADDMSAALAALSPHKRADAIKKFKNDRRDARRQKEYAERQYTQNPKLKETSPNMGSANSFLESQIGRHAPTEPVDWGEVPVRLLADDIRMSPKEFDQSPFDAIRYHDTDYKSWAVPSRTQIRSAINKEPLVNLPEELPSFRTLQSGGGKSYPRDPLLALDTQKKLDEALEHEMITKEEYDMMINEILLSTPNPMPSSDMLDNITGYSNNDKLKGKVPKNSAMSSSNPYHDTIDPSLGDFLNEDFSVKPIKGNSGNVMITGTDQIKVGKVYKVTKPDGNHFVFNTLDGGDAKALAEDFGQGFQIEEMSNTSLLDQYTADFAQKGLTGSGKKPWEGMGQGEKEIVDFLKLSGYLHKNTLEPTKKNIVNLEHLQKAANQENLTKPEIIYLADKYGIDYTQIKFKDNNFELENEPEFDPAYDFGSTKIGSALGNFIADTPEAMADPFVAKYNALPDYSKTYMNNYLKIIGGPEALSKDTIDEAMIAGHLEKPEYEYLMDVLADVHKKALPDKNIMSTYNQPSKTKKTLSGFNLADYSDVAQKEYNGLLSVGYTEKEAKQIIWEKYK